MFKNNIKIAALQETKLNENVKTPEIPQFTPVRKDRERDKGGGLIFYIHESILFEQLPNIQVDPIFETLAIKIDDTTLINVYIPPESSCPQGFNPSLNNILPNNDAIILGDMNAHDPLWNSSLQDSRGEKFSEEIGNSNFGVLNTEEPTRLPNNRDGRPSSPDISIASLALLPYTTWEVHTTLGSDHLPIIITSSSNIKPLMSDRKTYINFKKANWNEFKQDTEIAFSALESPTNIFKGEKTFRQIINKNSKKHIPHGRLKTQTPAPIPEDAAELIRQRDQLRQNDPTSPDLRDLNKEIEDKIKKNKRKIWREKIAELGSKTDSGKLFKLLKSLNGQPPAKDNQGIRFKGKYLTSATKIADSFNQQYSSVIRHKSCRLARQVTRVSTKQPLSEHTKFDPSQTETAIKKAKASKAIGPDGISNLHLKNIGPIGISYLTKLFDLSMEQAKIPMIWKKSTIIPLLKPGKPADESGSYRPVSLLCPAIKILERLVLPTLQEHLPIPTFQHGFRANHSTTSALNNLNLDISQGFNQKKPPHRTVLLQIDLSKAFDMVSHTKLLQDLNNSSLPPGTKRWLNCYLKGRQSRVKFRNQTSKSRNVRAGVPQGAVTSPILFNFYLTNLPAPPPGIKVIQYADDISIYMCSKKSINEMSREITVYIDMVVRFLEERELKVSPEKSTVTLFTPDPAQFKTTPPVKIKSQQVKLDQEPKLLGVHFDTMYTFSKHIAKTVTKAKKKLNLLKSLTGTDWGHDKETLCMTYKSTVKSVLEYAAPVWSPAISDTNWDKLQRVQNSALRIATGTYTMASVQHLHRETKILPLKEHGRLLTTQYLAACHLPGHPGREHLTRPPSSRQKKQTLLDYLPSVSTLFPDDPTEQDYKSAIKQLHKTTVESTINAYPNNKVLDDIPPDIHPEEEFLPRSTRATLSQLRSGYSKMLNSYNNILDENIQNVCPKCNESPHDTHHLFRCRDNPTTLSVISLWTDPISAAEMLGLKTGTESEEEET